MMEVSMSAISDILDDFDVDETSKLLEEQIINRESYSTPMIDQFQPLYKNYSRIINSGEATDEEILEGTEKFYKICDALLGCINEKFGVSLDDGWSGDNRKDVPAVAMALYQFFVLDIYANVLEILRNYISKNQGLLYNQFKDVPRKSITKAAVTPQADVIMRNIYDICSFILGELTADTAISCFDEGYIPAVIVHQLMERDALDGDFVTQIAEVFNHDISFKSQIGFDLIYKIQTGSLDFKPTSQDQSTTEGE